MSGSSADRGGVDAVVLRLLTPRRRRLRHLLPRQPHPSRAMLGPFECHQIGPSKRLSEIRLHAISLVPGTKKRRPALVDGPLLCLCGNGRPCNQDEIPRSCYVQRHDGRINPARPGGGQNGRDRDRLQGVPSPWPAPNRSPGARSRPGHANARVAAAPRRRLSEARQHHHGGRPLRRPFADAVDAVHAGCASDLISISNAGRRDVTW
jgi:hypothetical protein